MRKKPCHRPIHSILICHRGALGDFVLTWPALYALRKALPTYRFFGLGRPEYMRLAIILGLLDRCFPMESAGMLDFFAGKAVPPEIGSPHGAVLWLSSGREIAALLKKSALLPVALIDPFPVKTSCSNILPSAHRVNKEGAGNFQEKKIHVALYHCLSIQCHFPVSIPSPLSPYFPLKGKRGRYALIHPGSGSPRKNFSPRFYRDLAVELRQCGYEKVSFIFGPAEENLLMEEFTEESIERPENIEILARLLAGAALYVGNDSGVSHLSGILGTPTIALYKTTDPEIWGVMGKKVTHISELKEKSAFLKIQKCLQQQKTLQKISG